MNLSHDRIEILQRPAARVFIFRRSGRFRCLGQQIIGQAAGGIKRLEFIHESERKALPAVALCSDIAILTCVGNDYSFADIYKRQVEAHVRAGDVLWAFSASGSSPNIIAAAERARSQGGKVLAFTGKADSKLESIADVCVCAKSDVTSSSQEIHELAYHIVCDLVEKSIAESR